MTMWAGASIRASDGSSPQRLELAQLNFGEGQVAVREETLRHLSPYLTEHINRFGVYEWNPQRVIPPINDGLEILPASHR